MEGINVAIIGGTGVGSRLLALPGQPLHVPTALGMVRGRIVSHEGVSLLVIGRHSKGHKVPPHAVNYAAMALALRSLNIAFCLSTAAVGSLRMDWAPGTLVACSDFLDLSSRNLTLFVDRFEHRDFGRPFSSTARSALSQASVLTGIALQQEGVYCGVNGPRYETPQEIVAMRALGAELVGMTAASEAIVMREATIEYACLAIVTNLAAGMSVEGTSAGPLNHLDVEAQLRLSADSALNLLLRAAVLLARDAVNQGSVDRGPLNRGPVNRGIEA